MHLISTVRLADLFSASGLVVLCRAGIASEITAMPAMLAAQGVPDASDVLEDSNGLRGPMPLHKLIDSMQDTVTKQDCEELLGEFLNQPALELDIPRTSAPSTGMLQTVLCRIFASSTTRVSTVRCNFMTIMSI